MEKTIENKDELVDQESTMKCLEFQSSITNQNGLPNTSSINEEIMVKETIIDHPTIDKKVAKGIEKDGENVPTKIEALHENEPSSSKHDDINGTVHLEHHLNPVDAKNMKNSEVQCAITSLSFIASAYDNSDSENDGPQCIYEQRIHSNEMEVQITKEYRNKPTTSTSDEDSDSADSSHEDDSSSSSEAESGANNDSAQRRTSCKKKDRLKASPEKEMKGEFDDLPPIEELKISVPEVLCDPLGEVGWMVEQMVVVRPKPGKPTLNLDTILFVERGQRVLGRIFDVFGQVSEPHYCVRFNSTEHIKESDIKVGMIVYFCPNTEYTSVVFLHDLLQIKATDELGDDEHPEFSDDEEERAYYTALKQKQKNDKTKSSGEAVPKRPRTDVQDSGWKSNHPWSTTKKQQQQQKQAKKPGNVYKTPDWSTTQQRARCHPSYLWQYPSSYPNNSWPVPETYQGNGWPQNPYGYNEPFVNPHQQGTTRPFFRAPHTFQSGPEPYMQNSPYPSQSNTTRYPVMNFSWQSQARRQSGTSWPVPPLPPPPPGV